MRFLVGICASIVALIVSAPAFANVTAATIATQNANYMGPCPVTIVFTGSITAAGNTSYAYGFNHFLNGKVQPLVPGGTGSGSITTNNDAITFTSSSAAGSWDQIDVHNISTGQPDFYGNILHFSVTCVAPPTPTPSSGFFHSKVIYQLAPPNPPTGVKQTTNEQECGAHGFGFGCPLAMSNGYLVLVWCWQPAGCNPASSTSQNIKAFNVYEVDNGKHVVVDNVNPDNGGNLPTAGSVSPPPGGFANQCYAVTAVMSDNRESGRSNAVCLGNGTVGNVDTIYHATASMDQGESHAYNDNTFPLSSGECSPGPLCLGWYHDEGSVIAPNIIPLWYWNDNYRTYYLFDLSSIAGHYVASATLRVPVTGGSLNCFSALAAANAPWDPNTSFLAFIGGDFRAAGGSIGSPIDVTDIVRAWVAGSANNGFVLRGFNEKFDAEASHCITTLGTDATLEIAHS